LAESSTKTSSSDGPLHDLPVTIPALCNFSSMCARFRRLSSDTLPRLTKPVAPARREVDEQLEAPS